MPGTSNKAGANARITNAPYSGEAAALSSAINGATQYSKTALTAPVKIMKNMLFLKMSIPVRY